MKLIDGSHYGAKLSPHEIKTGPAVDRDRRDLPGHLCLAGLRHLPVAPAAAGACTSAAASATARRSTTSTASAWCSIFADGSASAARARCCNLSRPEKSLRPAGPAGQGGRRAGTLQGGGLRRHRRPALPADARGDPRRADGRLEQASDSTCPASAPTSTTSARCSGSASCPRT